MAGNETVTGSFSGLLEIPFSDIEFGKRIGWGLTSSVFKGVWKTNDNSLVAIKQLTHFLKTELIMLKKIKDDEGTVHIGRKFIIEILGVITQEPWSCIIMEYAANGSLLQYLSRRHKQQQPRENDIFFTWTRQGALAIEYLHEHDIIHRDIKSPNFVITDQYILKLCDFGISRITDGTKSTSFAGSLAWMAPESRDSFKEGSNRIKVSKRSDIYSYGVVIWEMWTLREPFKTKKVDGMYPLDEGTPSKLKGLLHGCWEVDRMLRPTIPEILKAIEDLAFTLCIEVKHFMEPHLRRQKLQELRHQELELLKRIQRIQWLETKFEEGRQICMEPDVQLAEEYNFSESVDKLQLQLQQVKQQQQKLEQEKSQLDKQIPAAVAAGTASLHSTTPSTTSSC